MMSGGKKGLILVRNLSSSIPHLDYDELFVSTEIIEEEYGIADVFNLNLDAKKRWIEGIVDELSVYLDRKITWIKPEDIDRYDVVQFDILLQPFETTNIDHRKVNKIVSSTSDIKLKYTFKTFYEANFSTFSSLSFPFEARTSTELKVKHILDSYSFENYAEDRTKIKHLTMGLSRYLALGIVDFRSILFHTKHLGFEHEFNRQVCFIPYLKSLYCNRSISLNSVQDSHIRLLERIVLGDFQSTSVDKFFASGMKQFLDGRILTNRFRLMFVYYTYIQHKIPWELGCLLFSKLIDFHPSVNLGNWDKQAKSRFLKGYNIPKQIQTFGE